MLAAVVTLAVALTPNAQGAQGLTTGVFEELFQSPDADVRDVWFDRAVEADAGIARVNVRWENVAPFKPANPTDPADSVYRFGPIDDAVRGGGERGLDILIVVHFAPTWAEGPNRDPGAPTGSWKPNADALADFATALATRYSGVFPDPDGPGRLPKVGYYDPWNEPDHPVYLTPQWNGKKPKSPTLYRELLNGFYDSVKDVDKSIKVVGPSGSPFGDPRGVNRMRPIYFLRELLCVQGKKNPKAGNCAISKLPKLDIVSHHPISLEGPPTRSAVHPDDATSADLDRVRKVARAAAKGGNILPRISGKKKSKPRKIWNTEFWWWSDPPESRGVSPSKQASWLAESLYIFWKDGASAAVNFGLDDSFGSGLYFDDGTAKPALTAFRFPFVGDRKSEKKIKIWGKAPVGGTLKVQEKRGSGWKTIERFKVKKGKVFFEKISLSGAAKLRGQVKGETSRTWKQKR